MGPAGPMGVVGVVGIVGAAGLPPPIPSPLWRAGVGLQYSFRDLNEMVSMYRNESVFMSSSRCLAACSFVWKMNEQSCISAVPFVPTIFA